MGKTGILVAWQVGGTHVTWGVKLFVSFFCVSFFLCYPSTLWLSSSLSLLALAHVLQRGATPVSPLPFCQILLPLCSGYCCISG